VWLGDVIGLIFAIYIAYAVVQVIQGYRLYKKRTATTTGRALAVRFGKLHMGTNVPKTEIAFFDSLGRRYVFHSSVGASWISWPDQVEVWYDPGDPTNAEIKIPESVIFFLVAMCCFFVGVFASSALDKWPAR